MNTPLIILIFIHFLFLANPQPEFRIESDPVQKDTVHLSRGSMLAFLIGIMKPDAMEARNRYFETVFPIASEYQYNQGVVFNVLEPTRGNYHPGFVAIASWPAAKNRQQFLEDPRMPKDIPDRRREIWARFDQMFFEEIAEDISFEVSSGKVYVFTNFWVNDQATFNRYLDSFVAEMPGMEGKFLVMFQEGKSPKNHMYEPDAVIISEWNDPDSFRRFLQKMDEGFPEDGLKNTNEFITSYVFGFGS